MTCFSDQLYPEEYRELNVAWVASTRFKELPGDFAAERKSQRSIEEKHGANKTGLYNRKLS